MSWSNSKGYKKPKFNFNQYFVYIIIAIVAIPISIFFIYLTLSMMAFGPNTDLMVSIVSPELFLVMRWGLIFITALIFFVFLPLAMYRVFRGKRLI